MISYMVSPTPASLWAEEVHFTVTRNPAGMPGEKVVPAPPAFTAAQRGWIPISGNLMHPRYLKGHADQIVKGAESVGKVADRAAWREANVNGPRRIVEFCQSAMVNDDEATYLVVRLRSSAATPGSSERLCPGVLG